MLSIFSYVEMPPFGLIPAEKVSWVLLILAICSECRNFNEVECAAPNVEVGQLAREVAKQVDVVSVDVVEELVDAADQEGAVAYVDVVINQ